MPLPIDTPLLINPMGGPTQSKPKHAVLVSLSLEALQALEDPNQVRVDFEFGDQPGIYIGERFFPISRQSEDIRHELYLRAATANKPNPPLRHHATITGKLEVTRKLGHDLTAKLRNTREQQKQEHDNRRIILMDNPPDTVPLKKKKEPNSVPRKPVARPVADNLPPQPQRTTPVPQPQRATPVPSQVPGVAPLRSRFVHFIARAERTKEETIKALGGETDPSCRHEILSLLNELAEQIPPPGLKATEKLDTSKCKWRLQAKSWLEVRPWDWPKLSETERTVMARSARQACSHIKIPESDPVWGHFRFRQTGTTSTDSSRDTPLLSSEPPKRAVSSAQVKTKKPKVTKEIQIRDESKPVPKPGPVLPPQQSTTPSPSGSSTSRKPGSGYKLSRQPSQDLPLAAKARPSDPRLKDGLKKSLPVVEVEKEKRKEKERSESDREATSKRREKVTNYSDQDTLTGRESQREATHRVEKGKERENPSSLKRKARPVPPEDSTPQSTSSTQVKRRKIDQDPRRLSVRPNDLDGLAPTKVVKKEPSPLPPRQAPPANSTKSNGMSKSRRKSPVYTSSEDEDDHKAPTLPTPPTLSSHSRNTSISERATLRAKYNSKYMEQLDSYRDVCILKRRIEELLGNQNPGTITDIEMDMDVEAVVKKYSQIREELVKIRQVYDRLRRE